MSVAFLFSRNTLLLQRKTTVDEGRAHRKGNQQVLTEANRYSLMLCLPEWSGCCWNLEPDEYSYIQTEPANGRYFRETNAIVTKAGVQVVSEH